VTENADGTFTITGIVASGGGDSFSFDGSLIDVSLLGPGTVYVDGSQIDTAAVTLDNTLVIEGAGVEYTGYEVSVDGAIAADLDADEFNSGDSVGAGTASGTTYGGADSYVFSGEITSFELDGTAGVYVNGTQVDPVALGTGGEATLDHLLELNGTDTATDYEFSVTGEVEASPDAASVEASDDVTGSSVAGTVDDDVDAYRFSGELERLSLDGTANVSFQEDG
jgi:hypothetical protein